MLPLVRASGTPPSQDAGGTDVFAEKRARQPHLIDSCHGQHDDENDQNAIFQICQDPQGAGAEFGAGNFVQQLLKPSKGTQKAAYHASQQDAQKHEDPRNVIGHIVFRRADDRLKRTDGTGARRSRAGIAVQARDTYAFERAAV